MHSPKGGALHGIGEKSSPDLHTGTGNFSVPIALPPCRNGLQPQLNLAYSTGSGNGPFGLGWGLSVPGISRQTSHGSPRYIDAQDAFILSGAEDLVHEQQPGVTRYRPRTEGLFARIEHHRHDRNDFWKMWSKSTRLGNATGWTPMLGRSPFGQWELELPNTAGVRNLFESEAIVDILFVITYGGLTPAWPQ